MKALEATPMGKPSKLNESREEEKQLFFKEADIESKNDLKYYFSQTKPANHQDRVIDIAAENSEKKNDKVKNIDDLNNIWG